MDNGLAAKLNLHTHKFLVNFLIYNLLKGLNVTLIVYFVLF